MGSRSVIDELRGRIGEIESGSPSSTAQRRKTATREARCQEKDSTSPEAAFSKIVAILNVGDKSEWAIRDRLSREGYATESIDEAVERAKSYGYIDDARFAGVLIRSRIAQGKGVCGIERELRNQDIDIESVPGWPHEFGVNDDSELDRACSLLEAKPPRSKNPREGAYRKLVGKGYSSSIASSAARLWHERSCVPVGFRCE